MANDDTLSLKGVHGLKKEIRRYYAEHLKNCGLALIDGANIVLEKSQENVPVLTGKLKSTGKVGNIKKDKDEMSIPITYGNESDVDYAIYVHEHDAGRGHKFLEKALNESEQKVLNIFAEKIK